MRSWVVACRLMISTSISFNVRGFNTAPRNNIDLCTLRDFCTKKFALRQVRSQFAYLKLLSSEIDG